MKVGFLIFLFASLVHKLIVIKHINTVFLLVPVNFLHAILNVVSSNLSPKHAENLLITSFSIDRTCTASHTTCIKQNSCVVCVMFLIIIQKCFNINII